MAQRATGISKKLEVESPAFGSVSASDIIRAPAARRAIPLELASLLTPYKGRSGLSLRIERVPQLARLSAGRENNDGSWSLASDELSGLTYLLPKILTKEHTLAIRILALEGTTETTLKVVDLAIAPDSAAPAAAHEEEISSPKAAKEREAPRQSELKNMLSIFAVREADLDAVRQELERVKAQKEADLATARAAWTAELNERLSAAAKQAASDIARERHAWQLEQNARIAELEAQAAARFAEEREQDQRENRRALVKSEKRWKAEEAERQSEARAAWSEQSAHTLSEVTERLRRSEKALAEARARIDATPPPKTNEAELLRLRNDLAAMKGMVADKEGELAEQRRLAEQTAERAQLDFEKTLMRASAGWKAEEAARLAVAEAKWHEQLDHVKTDAAAQREGLELALAEAQSRAEARAPSAENEVEMVRLRNALAVAQNVASNRAAELEEQRLNAGRISEQAAQSSEAALLRAKMDWEAGEAARLIAAEERWRQQSEGTLAAATKRCEAAEQALADARRDHAAAGRRGDTAYVERLRSELAALQTTLADREAELIHARSSIEQLRARYWPEVGGSGGGAWVEGGPEEQSVRRANLRLVRDVVVVVSLVMSLILFFPRLVSFLPDSWRANVASLTGAFDVAPAVTPPPAHTVAPKPPPAPPPAKQQEATVSHAANVRSSPSVSGAVISILQRGSSVTVYERRGNWTLVGYSVAGGNQSSQQGWVYSSYLKSGD